MDAGQLRERVELLELIGGEDSYEWRVCGQVWAKTERQRVRNIFSSVGLSAESIKITVRERDLTPRNAVRWKGVHCFITSICRDNPGYLEISAAMTNVCKCLVTRTSTERDELNRPVTVKDYEMSFPACLTEKYLGHAQLEPMAVSEIRYVLITPKEIELTVGKAVLVSGVLYTVLLCHTLDEYKNEYEIAREKDC